MKEARYFYVPNAINQSELPEEESRHASKVLRLDAGDEIFLMDGVGNFYRAEITLVTKKQCLYNIIETIPQQKAWTGEIHIGIAPTKNIDRMEWMVEKCTEIGMDSISFLNCKFSERKQLRADRIEKIRISAAKQSRKPFFPKVENIIDFHKYINIPREGNKYICHCYNEIPQIDLFKELCDSVKNNPIYILIGPEGDFSIDEVEFAMQNGYKSATLGNFRLRTETAGVLATTVSQLAKRKI